MAGDRNSDDEACFAPRLRHPMECLPHRPERTPAWRPRRGQRSRSRPDPAERRSFRHPRIVAAPDLGPVRINFRYAGFQSVVAAFSEKAGMAQYFEGPHETYGFFHHEIHPRWLDLQYQAITCVWETAAGRSRSMTLDYGVETEDGQVVFGEDKATDEYFDNDPDLCERLDLVEEFLNTKGATLERRVAGDLDTDMKRRIVKNVFCARRTTFGDADVARVRKVILDNGGTAPLGDVLRAIGSHPRLSEDTAYAMMHHRHIVMPISLPPMPDTPVTIPKPAMKGALRAFLAAHVPSGEHSQ